MSDDLGDALVPLLAAAGLDLIDVEVHASLVRVTVDREGGIDLEALAAANRVVSAELDLRDPIPGRYTLEVSSPGVERRLRTPDHFARAIGETVTVRSLPDTTPLRRFEGKLVASDDTGFVLEGAELPGGSQRTSYADVERARTVFTWGPTEKPGGAASKAARRQPAQHTPTPTRKVTTS